MPLSGLQVSSGICADEICRQAGRDRELRRQWSEQAAAFTEQLGDLKAQLDEHTAPPVTLIPVPANLRQQGSLTAERRNQFRRHLEGLFESLERDDVVTVDVPSPHIEKASTDGLPESVKARVGMGCRTCRGWCCNSGGNHAHLRAAAMFRRQEDHPELSREEIIETYLEHIPDKAYEGSCIFHTDQGCNLRPDWRSPTCNVFFCASLKHYMANSEQAGDDIAFVSVRRGEFLRLAIVRDDDYEELDLPLKA
jgi:hypothetical protein